jgi:TM2 domain-containing membrane protein YozV
MADRTSTSHGQLVSFPNIKYIYYGLCLLIFLISIGQLYILTGLTGLYFGLPLWVWLMNIVFGIMILIAWIAVHLRRIAMKGDV